MLLSVIPSPPAYSGADTAYTLENGLKVILAPQPGNPVVSGRVLVKAGSSSESGQAEYGLAHLMEHMAFKGTLKREVGEISRLVETNGGDINAYTSYDETVYYLSLPGTKLELALDLLQDMVFFPKYDPDEYAREKEVVIEEINRSDDNPDRSLSEEFFALAFSGGHPYGHRILGSADTVRGASRDTAFAFHNKFYRPDNAVLILTGGFSVPEAKTLVEKYFGSVENPAGAVKEDLSDTPPALGPVVKIVYDKGAAQPQLLMGFRCPPASSGEAASLELLSALLSTGNSSRLNEEIRYKQGLVTSIYSAAFTLRRSGVFAVGFVTEPDKVVSALKAVFSELNKLPSEVPATDELARAVAITTKSFLDQQETPWSLGRQIESFELYTGDYRLKDAYVPAWKRIASPDLVSLARELFKPENLTLVLMLPEGEKGITEADLLQAASELSLPEPASGNILPKAAFQSFTLENGVRVLAQDDPSISLVEVKLGVLGGRLSEGVKDAGLSSLTAQVWALASTKRKAPEMARAVEALGVSINGYGGRNTMGLDASFMGSNWREGLSLFAELLKSPAFNEEDFRSKKAEQLAYLLSLEEDLPSRLFKILRLSLYGAHPYAVDTEGTKESVESLKREDLERHYHELIRPENVVIAVSGDVDPREFVAALEEELKDWKPRGKEEKVVVPDPPAPVKGPLLTTEELDRQQTHLAVAFLAPALGAPDQAAMDVLSSVLSGMGGVLFQELREKRSLAYTVAGPYGAGLKTGAITFYIGCSPEKTREALDAMLAIVGDLKKEPLDLETVEGAKTYLLGVNKLRHQTLSSRASEALVSSIYGMGTDRYDRYQDEIARVTPEDVMEAAKNYLNVENSVLAVLGSAGSISTASAIVTGEPLPSETLAPEGLSGEGGFPPPAAPPAEAR
ncbi:MAG: insulinase family protein [Deltaproteobacteria bacterium]|jgi:zinc protease|nr:insulinase family protein [Deltaproteobacteria bacterium]